jgi:hypothetical protein
MNRISYSVLFEAILKWTVRICGAIVLALTIFLREWFLFVCIFVLIISKEVMFYVMRDKGIPPQ